MPVFHIFCIFNQNGILRGEDVFLSNEVKGATRAHIVMHIVKVLTLKLLTLLDSSTKFGSTFQYWITLSEKNFFLKLLTFKPQETIFLPDLPRVNISCP